MKKTVVISGILISVLAVGLVIICSGAGKLHPTVQATTNQHRDWHANCLRAHLSSLRPENGQVRMIGWLSHSTQAVTRILKVGYRIRFTDYHRSRTFTIVRIEDDGVVFEYESTFDYRAFGKNLVKRDSGTFKLA